MKNKKQPLNIGVICDMDKFKEARDIMCNFLDRDKDLRIAYSSNIAMLLKKKK